MEPPGDEVPDDLPYKDRVKMRDHRFSRCLVCEHSISRKCSLKSFMVAKCPGPVQSKGAGAEGRKRVRRDELSDGGSTQASQVGTLQAQGDVSI